MKGLVAVFLGLVLGSCSSSSSNNSGGNPQALCMQGVTALCNKVYDCAEGEPLRPFLGGTTKAECISMNNAAQCTEATGCATGETYHADQAQACLSAFNAIACAQLTDPTAIAPASCDAICTAAN